MAFCLKLMIVGNNILLKLFHSTGLLVYSTDKQHTSAQHANAFVYHLCKFCETDSIVSSDGILFTDVRRRNEINRSSFGLNVVQTKLCEIEYQLRRIELEFICQTQHI